MDIVMLQTITDSINQGRTTQTFTLGSRYEVPAEVGQTWIRHGWARALAATAKPDSRHAPGRG